MKDAKAKYIIIEATEIKKQLYKVTREFAFNDFDNIYEPTYMMDAKQFFEKYGIPEEFQKIIVKINTQFFLKKEAEEYITGFPFDIMSGKIRKENNKKTLTVFNCPIYDYYANQLFRDKIRFRTQLIYSNLDDVMRFLLKINGEGYLKGYLQSIKDFFDISLNLDLLLEVLNESQNDIEEEMKLYRRF